MHDYQVDDGLLVRRQPNVGSRAGSQWLTKGPRASGVRLRLFCFPYAGGWAERFHTWERALPREVDLCPVQPPGRGNRLSEEPQRNLYTLAQDAASAISGLLDVPFVLFGHSLGALVGFEVARNLRYLGLRSPQCLIVSACRAPHTLMHTQCLHRMSEPQLTRELRALGGTPEEVLSEPRLLRCILPTLRADFETFESYSFRPGKLLDCPIYGYAGASDPRAPAEGMRGWQDHTAQTYSLKLLPGGHFFLHESEVALLDHLWGRLRNLY